MEAPVSPTTPMDPAAAGAHQRRGNRRTLKRLAVIALPVLAAAVLSFGPVTATTATPANAAPAAVPAAAAAAVAGQGYLPGANHVFVINLENKGYDETWGPASAAPVPLPDPAQPRRTAEPVLRHRAQLAAQLRGADFRAGTQPADAGRLPELHAVRRAAAPPAPARQSATAACSRPACPRWPGSSRTPARPGRGTWRTWERHAGTLRWAPSMTPRRPKSGDQYAARHNPFVYFAGITGSPDCAKNDVDLSALQTDLASAATTPNLSMITPNLCHDGHDSPCVDGQPGGLTSADDLAQTVGSGDHSTPPRSSRTACW